MSNEITMEDKSSNYISFDEMAVQYDETRNFDEGSLNSALDYFVSRFPPTSSPYVFEPGIGTGRIALPFARRGYKVTGVDVSEKMLEVLDRKMKETVPLLPISFCRADVRELPFTKESFDVAVIVHLFYFIRKSQLLTRDIKTFALKRVIQLKKSV